MAKTIEVIDETTPEDYKTAVDTALAGAGTALAGVSVYPSTARAFNETSEMDEYSTTIHYVAVIETTV